MRRVVAAPLAHRATGEIALKRDECGVEDWDDEYQHRKEQHGEHALRECLAARQVERGEREADGEATAVTHEDGGAREVEDEKPGDGANEHCGSDGAVVVASA